MFGCTWFGRRAVALAALALSTVLTLSSTVVALAVSVVQVSSDPYTNSGAQHATQDEPASFSFGNTVVTAFVSGRYATGGGGTNISWATSTDAGQTWTTGNLPGVGTIAGGQYDRNTNPSVAYDPKHNVWIILSKDFRSPASLGLGILASRSTDGGLTWQNPVIVVFVSGGGFYDKPWLTCDTWVSSPYYGNCYAVMDDYRDSQRLKFTRSTDGGLTWSPLVNNANGAGGFGGELVVQPSGTVVMAYRKNTNDKMMAIGSTNGGVTWSKPAEIDTFTRHKVAGGLRASYVTPSVAMDGSGKVYVVWADCRFRSDCSANDIVMSTSSDGITWSPTTRIPIDATNSTVDHFLPGLGADVSTSGSGAHLGLIYYYYTNAHCRWDTCQLYAGFVSSTDGGATWSTSTQLAGPMQLAWLPNTSSGRMLGDYMSVSFAAGKAVFVFPVAQAPTGTLPFNQAMYSPLGGISVGRARR